MVRGEHHGDQERQVHQHDHGRHRRTPVRAFRRIDAATGAHAVPQQRLAADQGQQRRVQAHGHGGAPAEVLQHETGIPAEGGRHHQHGRRGIDVSTPPMDTLTNSTPSVMYLKPARPLVRK